MGVAVIPRFVCLCFKSAHLVAIAPSFTVRIASTQQVIIIGMHVVILIESKQEGVRYVAKRGFNLRHAITQVVHDCVYAAMYVEPYLSREDFFTGSRSTVSLYSGPTACQVSYIYMY